MIWLWRYEWLWFRIAHDVPAHLSSWGAPHTTHCSGRRASALLWQRSSSPGHRWGAGWGGGDHQDWAELAGSCWCLVVTPTWGTLACSLAAEWLLATRSRWECPVFWRFWRVDQSPSLPGTMLSSWSSQRRYIPDSRCPHSCCRTWLLNNMMSVMILLTWDIPSNISGALYHSVTTSWV